MKKITFTLIIANPQFEINASFNPVPENEEII
jgi:hypothetical protein